MTPCIVRRVLSLLLIGSFVVLGASLPLRAQTPATKQPPKKAAAESAKDTEVEQAIKRFETEGRDVFKGRNEIVATCQLKPGMNVADVGAGTGLFTRLMAAKVAPGGKVFAVDILKKYVDHIQETCRQEKIANVVGVVCKADSTELAPASVDLAFICDTYHHFEHPEKNLASIHQALRPGARLVVVEFRKEKGVTEDWVMKHVRPDRETLIKEITQAGFKLIDEPALMKTQQVYRFVKK